MHNYLENAAPTEVAAIVEGAALIQRIFLTEIPSDAGADLLERHFAGSYSRMHWWLQDVTENLRPLDQAAVSAMKDVFQTYLYEGKLTSDTERNSAEIVLMVLNKLVKRKATNSTLYSSVPVYRKSADLK